MPIKLKNKVAKLKKDCSIEEAEALLEWFLEHPDGRIDFSNCSHFHTAILQVLMAQKPELAGNVKNSCAAMYYVSTLTN